MTEKDKPEIVHCRDCERIHFVSGGLPPMVSLACGMFVHAENLSPDDYCSKGVKRKEAKE